VPFEDGGDTDCIHRAVFFSLPSVVYSARQHPMPTQPSDVRIFPDVDRVFVNGYKQGYLFIGIANLPMVATKQIAEAVVQECILQVIRQLTPPIDAVYYSPHLLSENHEHSLPHPYFAFKARDRFKINLEASVMVGCTRIDQQFAKNAGIGAYACRDTFFFGGDIQYEQTASPEEAIVELFKGCEPLT
jgi:histidinol phosphatase-like enzyme